MTIKASGASPLSQSRVEAKHHYRFKYLKSDHWSNLRIAKLASVDAKCERCYLRDLSNDVHHLRYRKLYDVQLEDLVVLCRGCHDLTHEALEVCREFIKKSEDVWKTTRMVINWQEQGKINGVSSEIYQMVNHPKFVRRFWQFCHTDIEERSLESFEKFVAEREKKDELRDEWRRNVIEFFLTPEQRIKIKKKNQESQRRIEKRKAIKALGPGICVVQSSYKYGLRRLREKSI